MAEVAPTRALLLGAAVAESGAAVARHRQEFEDHLKQVRDDKGFVYIQPAALLLIRGSLSRDHERLHLIKTLLGRSLPELVGVGHGELGEDLVVDAAGELVGS